MAEPRTYPPGVTCWIDTAQPDPRAASQFYGALFGWTLTELTPPGSYLVATLGGQDVAAIAPASAGVATWNTYVAVAVVAAPADAGLGARTGICVDPAGAEFRLWQPLGRPGAQVTNAPGSWNFSDLQTPDRDAAMAFYTPVFGWRAVDMAQGAGTMIQVPGYGDHLAATVDPGIYERQASAPPGFADVIGALAFIEPGEPARWHVTFSVADRDGSVATAERFGATVLASSDDPWTKNAVVRDPQGAEFSISQFSPSGG
jgi:predicted enzyme related to lactoylglutathione lyase